MQKKVSNKFYSFVATVLLLAAVSCKKEKQQQPPPVSPTPAMEYFNFNDKEIKAGTGFSVDLNHDGRKDMAFYTLLVGDPIFQVDKLQFLVETNIGTNLPVNNREEIPVLQYGAPISLSDFDDYHWFELSSVMLVQKTTSFTQPPLWEGHWKNAVHQYIPYQIVVASKIYNGWVEISVDTLHEKLVLHKAALSKEAGKIIKAGI